MCCTASFGGQRRQLLCEGCKQSGNIILECCRGSCGSFYRPLRCPAAGPAPLQLPPAPGPSVGFVFVQQQHHGCGDSSSEATAALSFKQTIM